ncbi:TIGR02556 family CRISPR-associated protein [Carboxydocella sp. ULO1]|uniref:TIGR02556 family CRISPR-associated protein n=1 Tax=Carboxydocella sp. ULO1 TaxID=1926599 RepID=UPI0009C6F672|nr:TIGR02556 family CRISPR-associated protein [Carboxydocella sp. ULO1]GAW29844.1 type I-B CRISPR-associated protein Cas8b/Csh1 [Carboxydocella sp. ULO1]
MLTAVRELGELLLEGKEPIEVLTKPLGVDKVAAVEIQLLTKLRFKENSAVEEARKRGKKGEGRKKVRLIPYLFRYKGTKLEDWDSSRQLAYLYRQAGGNSPDFSLTTKVNEDEPTKTLDNKILGWFRNVRSLKIGLGKKDAAFLDALERTLVENREAILKDITQILQEKSKKEKIALTVKIVAGKKKFYPGEIPLFREVLLKRVYEKDMEVVSSDKICSLCGEKKPYVFGNSSPYKIYTLDKTGYIAGGFNRELAWRNFPLCGDCKLALEEGKKFIEENLQFSFSGISYYLIPKFLLGKEAAKEVVAVFTDSVKIVSLKQQVKKSITGSEKDILDTVKEASDTVMLNFLFLQKMNAAERIVMLIEDVLPSRLKKIFAAKEEVDKQFGGEFNFRILREFISKSDQDKARPDLDRYFLETVDRIFKDRPVDKDFLLKFIMQKIRYEFLHNRYFFQAVRDGLRVIAFLQVLGIWKGGTMVSTGERFFDQFFAGFASSFTDPMQKGLFLLGALTEFLLRRQKKDRNTDRPPFLKKLKGLKMNETDFKGLLPKVQNKLEEYEAFGRGRRLLAAEAAYYLLQSGSNWKASIDEMNFYFACGMNMTDEIAKLIYPSGEEVEEEEEKTA